MRNCTHLVSCVTHPPQRATDQVQARTDFRAVVIAFKDRRRKRQRRQVSGRGDLERTDDFKINTHQSHETHPPAATDRVQARADCRAVVIACKDRGEEKGKGDGLVSAAS